MDTITFAYEPFMNFLMVAVLFTILGIIYNVYQYFSDRPVCSRCRGGMGGGRISRALEDGPIYDGE